MKEITKRTLQNILIFFVYGILGVGAFAAWVWAYVTFGMVVFLGAIGLIILGIIIGAAYDKAKFDMVFEEYEAQVSQYKKDLDDEKEDG